jgi:hypothetical protein
VFLAGYGVEEWGDRKLLKMVIGVGVRGKGDFTKRTVAGDAVFSDAMLVLETISHA